MYEGTVFQVWRLRIGKEYHALSQHYVPFKVLAADINDKNQVSCLTQEGDFQCLRVFEITL